MRIDIFHAFSFHLEQATFNQLRVDAVHSDIALCGQQQRIASTQN
jgi:hypothetical protein